MPGYRSRVEVEAIAGHVADDAVLDGQGRVAVEYNPG